MASFAKNVRRGLLRFQEDDRTVEEILSDLPGRDELAQQFSALTTVEAYVNLDADGVLRGTETTLRLGGGIVGSSAVEYWDLGRDLALQTLPSGDVTAVAELKGDAIPEQLSPYFFRFSDE